MTIGPPGPNYRHHSSSTFPTRDSSSISSFFPFAYDRPRQRKGKPTLVSFLVSLYRLGLLHLVGHWRSHGAARRGPTSSSPSKVPRSRALGPTWTTQTRTGPLPVGPGRRAIGHRQGTYHSPRSSATTHTSCGAYLSRHHVPPWADCPNTWLGGEATALLHQRFCVLGRLPLRL